MKRILLAGVLTASSTLASAADLPSQIAPPVSPPPVFTWTGFTIGVTAGYAFDSVHSFTTTGNNAHTMAELVSGAHLPFIELTNNGFIGGGELGYNYQFANTSEFGQAGIVIGIEADAAYAGPGSSLTYERATGGPTNNFYSRTEFLGTVRGRLGYAVNNILVYGTGGFAYGGAEDYWGIITPTGQSSLSGYNTIRTGFAYGGGIAYALSATSFLNFFSSSAVILKAEYIHYDLGSRNLFVVAPVAPNTFNSQIKIEGNLVRAGLDFKFDFFNTPLPVVAKY